jgi:hypothetical protein
MYPVMVGASGSNQAANVDTTGLSFDSANNILTVLSNVSANNGQFTTIVNTASHTGGLVSVSGNITAGNYLNLANNLGGVSGHMVYNPTLLSIDFSFS